MIFKSSASEPISPCAHHSPTRFSSLFLPLLITSFLRAGGGLQPGHDRLEALCVCKREIETQKECTVWLDNARSCFSDTVQSKGVLYRSLD